jgi:DNA invertase Pin-like site-specific DNA recombinase
MKAVMYLRVSTREQDTDNQLPALQELAARRGFDVVEIYQEQESAWRAGQQRELARLIADLPKRHIDVLLVWALDRLTRGGIGAIFQLLQHFRLYGVQIISHREPWTEQSGPMADVFYAIVAWAAQFESEQISQRTKAGLVKAKANGKTLGRRPGSKDKAKRSRRGYLLRYAK